MTVTEPNFLDAALVRRVIKVKRSTIEGAKLQITINNRLGLPTSDVVRKIAAAKPA